MPFWPKRDSIFRLFSITTFITASLELTYHPILAPDRIDASSRSVSSRFRCPPEGGGYVVTRAWHPSVTRDACPGKILLAEQQVLSVLS